MFPVLLHVLVKACTPDHREIPGCIPYIFYMDIRSFGKAYEEFYYRIQDEGAKFIRGRVANILEDPKTRNLHVYADNTLLDRPVDMEVDLVVLAAAIQPMADTERTRRLFGVSCTGDGWLQEAHPKLNPCGTTTAGVFLPGVCQGPKDIPDTVASAEGAASAASIPIHKGEVELEPSLRHLYRREMCRLRHVREPLPLQRPCSRREGREDGYAGHRGQV